ncbi:hypothetical protein D3C87_1741300 [compost metagenome]
MSRISLFTVDWECLKDILEAHTVVGLFPHLLREVQVTLGSIDVWIHTKGKRLIDQ